jgi:hypothetical protein
MNILSALKLAFVEWRSDKGYDWAAGWLLCGCPIDLVEQFIQGKGENAFTDGAWSAVQDWKRMLKVETHED